MITCTMFKGAKELDGKIIGYTYEITFNKSLEHTGRYSGMERGLNEYVKRERRTNVSDNFKRLWYSIKTWIKG